MANLVEGTDVREILETDLTDLTPFIDTAHLEVKDLDLDDERKAQVEKWLAAHFAAIRDKRVESKSIEGNKEKYAGKTDMGYKSTQYGQQALLLDTSGGLEGSPDTDVVKFKHTG